MALTKSERRQRIKMRVRKKVAGTPDRPRLSVFRSNKEIYVQLINDLTGETLVSASSREKDVKAEGTKSEVVGKNDICNPIRFYAFRLHIRLTFQAINNCRLSGICLCL